MSPMKGIDRLKRETLLKQIIVLGSPLVLGILEIWHPVGQPNMTPFESILPVVDWWLTLHLLQLPLFGLLGIGVILLVHNLRGWATIVSRIGIAFFLIFYTALDAITGIAGGLLIRNARDLSSNVQIFASKQFEQLLFNPIVGGSTFSVIGVLGSGGWIIGVIAAAIALKRAGSSLFSFVLLIASAVLFGIAHVPPTGPLGMACFLMGVVTIDSQLWTGNSSSRKDQDFK